MEFIVAWIASIISTIGMQVVYELKVFKDVADNGYKIDLNKLSKINITDDDKSSKITLISNLIPIYNLLQMVLKVTTYKDRKDHIFRMFDMSNALIPFNEKEANDYIKRPTGFRAFILSLSDENEIDLSFKLTVYEGSESGNIYFNLDNENTKIEIKKITGVAKRFTPERQNAEVLQHLMIHKAINSDKFSEYNLDAFIEKYSDNKQEGQNEYSIENIKQELDDFKSVFITNDSKQEEKGYQYTKKK